MVQWQNNLGKNRTPICHPTVETNKRSYGPYPESISTAGIPCDFGYEVEVPKNQNFNDWFDAEHFLWTEPESDTSDTFAPVAIAGFHSEVKRF